MAASRSATATKAEPPIAAFPAHWAPNDIKIYKGSRFPKAYEGGAFIAFHGSWNRAPGPQGGYNVVFQPLADGKPSGEYIIFADGFAGAQKDPAAPPTGLLGLPSVPTEHSIFRRRGRPHLARHLQG